MAPAFIVGGSMSRPSATTFAETEPDIEVTRKPSDDELMNMIVEILGERICVRTEDLKTALWSRSVMIGKRKVRALVRELRREGRVSVIKRGNALYVCRKNEQYLSPVFIPPSLRWVSKCQ